MTPFDLEQAKAGKPVCTRDGRTVRILCFDRKDEVYPIVALVKGIFSENELVLFYTSSGKLFPKRKAEMLDLMMAPIHNQK